MEIFIVILGILVLLCIWIILFDSTRFVKTSYKYSDKRIQRSCRAVLISDLHNKSYGRNNESLLAAIREEKPDFILIAGDMITANRRHKFGVAIRLLSELKKDFPIYYANGNHEQYICLPEKDYGDAGKEYKKLLDEAGVDRLINSHVELAEYGISIYGLEIDRDFYRRFTDVKMDDDYLKTILGKADETKYNILLAHNPDHFEKYAEWGADLTLAGHIHGGIVRVPFTGKGVISPKFTLIPKYDGGEFAAGKAIMIVSRGLGTHTIPLRMFNPAELITIDFEGKTDGSDSC